MARNEASMMIQIATRFVKEKDNPTIQGIVDNKGHDAINTLEMGGTLRCIWEWEEDSSG
jgi:hypothetical protein